MALVSVPSSATAISASPVLTCNARVSPSGTLRMTIVFTFGTLRQYFSKASSSNSTPGLPLTYL